MTRANRGSRKLLNGPIAAILAAFARISRPAGLLLIPYLAWVTFALAPNLAIWQLNP